METGSTYGELARRTAVVLGVATLAFGAWLLLREAFSFVLLVFAGVLLGVLLDGATGFVGRSVPLPRRAVLGLVVAGLAAALAGGVWYLGPALGSQLGDLAETLPEAVEEVRGWLGERGWGREVLERSPLEEGGAQEAGSEPGGGSGGSSDLLGRARSLFTTTFGVVADVLIVLFLGFYFAAAPDLYVGPILRLLPPSRHERAREVAEELGSALRSWLGGRLASMAVVGALTATGLFLLGVPIALGLGVLAGLLSFVPFLGPIVSAVPAALVAFVERPTLALWVVGLFGVVQFVETYLITPLIQQRVVSLPPSALLASQILMGLVAGVLGVLLATPLAVVVVVLVQTLWVEGVLGEDVSLAGS